MSQILEIALNLRKQITLQPDNYELRLVYADALEELGDPVLLAEAEKIRSRKWKFWDDSYRGMGHYFPQHYAGRTTFKENGEFKGLIEVIRCRENHWFNHGEKYFFHYPIRRLIICEWPHKINDLFGWSSQHSGWSEHGFPGQITEGIWRLLEGHKDEFKREGTGYYNSGAASWKIYETAEEAVQSLYAACWKLVKS